MKLYHYGVLGLSLLLPVAALADFQYQETTQITGGSLLGLMKMAGAFSRQAKEAGAPIVSTVYVQGNRMARVNAQRIEIVDLDKETITNIDLAKHTYTQVTFDQMRQQLQQAVQQAKESQAQQKASAPSPQQQAPNNVDVKFKVNVRNTGATKQVNGVSASESILTMQMDATNTTNGQQGAFGITNDMWVAPEIPGYDEYREFNEKMAAKMGDIFSSSGMASSLAAMQPNQAQGMSEMVKEVSKLKGIPVQQVMRMGATANGEPLPAASVAALPPSSTSSDTPSAGDIAKQSAHSAIASQLSAFHLGGFGHNNTQVPAADAATDTATSGIASKLSGFGFGHKKKQTPPPADAANAQQTPTATVLMESQTNLTAFSSAPIDSAKFSVPAGFTQVEPPAQR